MAIPGQREKGMKHEDSGALVGPLLDYLLEGSLEVAIQIALNHLVVQLDVSLGRKKEARLTQDF